jgi:hypothetical protein
METISSEAKYITSGARLAGFLNLGRKHAGYFC